MAKRNQTLFLLEMINIEFRGDALRKTRISNMMTDTEVKRYVLI